MCGYSLDIEPHVHHLCAAGCSNLSLYTSWFYSTEAPFFKIFISGFPRYTSQKVRNAQLIHGPLRRHSILQMQSQTSFDHLIIQLLAITAYILSSKNHGRAPLRNRVFVFQVEIVDI